MVATPDTLVPSDAIIDLDGTRKTVDMALWTVAILRQDYITANTGNRPVFIDLEEKQGMVNTRAQDAILVRATPNFEPVTIGYGFQHRPTTVYMDVRSRGPRDNATRIEEEVMRVILSKRKDPFGDNATTGLTGRQWLSWDGQWQRFDDLTKEYYRRIGQFTLNWRYQKVEV